MRLKIQYILIGILLLSIVAMELRRTTEGFQTAVAPPASIKCSSVTQFGRKIWLCEDGNQSKALLAGPTGQIGQKYVLSGDQVCIKKDKDQNPGVYGCQDWERVRGERDLRTQVIQDHNDTCDTLVGAYWEFTDNLASIDDTVGVLKNARDGHQAADAAILAYQDRTTDPAVKSSLAKLRQDLAAKRPPIEQQYTALNTELQSSLNPRNSISQAVRQYSCNADIPAPPPVSDELETREREILDNWRLGGSQRAP